MGTTGFSPKFGYVIGGARNPGSHQSSYLAPPQMNLIIVKAFIDRDKFQLITS
jgi:hypothetical protein